MPTDTPFKNVQRAVEKEFARMGAYKVENTHGADSLTMLGTWRDGKQAQLSLAWTRLPHDPLLTGGDDDG